MRVFPQRTCLKRGVCGVPCEACGRRLCDAPQVCHIVQIAVSQRRILGYLEGSMVPFGRSVDCIKEQCAVRKQPVLLIPRKGDPNTPLATWEDARGRLAEILSDAATAGRPGVITLSNVKRLFRSRFGLELSETALGYSRLHDLLQERAPLPFSRSAGVRRGPTDVRKGVRTLGGGRRRSAEGRPAAVDGGCGGRWRSPKAGGGRRTSAHGGGRSAEAGAGWRRLAEVRGGRLRSAEVVGGRWTSA